MICSAMEELVQDNRGSDTRLHTIDVHMRESAVDMLKD